MCATLNRLFAIKPSIGSEFYKSGFCNIRFYKDMVIEWNEAAQEMPVNLKLFLVQLLGELRTSFVLEWVKFPPNPPLTTRE